jgi:hypothetical protein
MTARPSAAMAFTLVTPAIFPISLLTRPSQWPHVIPEIFIDVSIITP